MYRLLRLVLLGVFLLWQNFSIHSTAEEIACPSLPGEFEGLRIVQISDLHGRALGKDHRRLLAAVEESRPDLICITGDFFGSVEEWERILPLLPGLQALAPTYYVTGNHEWQVPELRSKLREMESAGIRVLDNDYNVIERGTQRLVIAGVHDPCGPFDQKTPAQLVAEIRRDQGEDAFLLMLAHRNDGLSIWAELGVDLVLSGHCHGGVVRLPLAGGLFGPGRELFPNYDSGSYKEGDTRLYVSRGLGYSRVKLRLFNRPHLPLLVLNSGEPDRGVP